MSALYSAILFVQIPISVEYVAKTLLLSRTITPIAPGPGFPLDPPSEFVNIILYYLFLF